MAVARRRPSSIVPIVPQSIFVPRAGRPAHIPPNIVVPCASWYMDDDVSTLFEKDDKVDTAILRAIASMPSDGDDSDCRAF